MRAIERNASRRAIARNREESLERLARLAFFRLFRHSRRPRYRILPLSRTTVRLVSMMSAGEKHSIRPYQSSGGIFIACMTFYSSK
jgi:hypothetical protein